MNLNIPSLISDSDYGTSDLECEDDETTSEYTHGTIQKPSIQIHSGKATLHHSHKTVPRSSISRIVPYETLTLIHVIVQYLLTEIRINSP